MTARRAPARAAERRSLPVVSNRRPRHEARQRAPLRPPGARPPLIRRIDPIAVLCVRAEARALLCRVGWFDLHEAVDGLQAYAEASGVVARLGQDAVQRILSEAFQGVRHD